MKTCTKCGASKPVTEYSKDANRRDGLRCSCKSCNRVYKVAWDAANIENVKAYNAKRYADNPDKYRANTAKWIAANPEKVREKSAKYYAANADKRRALASKYRSDNLDKVKDYIAKWRVANPEADRIYKHNRRAREVGKLSAGLAKRLFDLQRGKCACGCKQPLGDDYHLDHRMPLALGGTNTDDNMQLLRRLCNLQKHAKHPVDFMQSKGFLI